MSDEVYCEECSHFYVGYLGVDKTELTGCDAKVGNWRSRNHLRYIDPEKQNGFNDCEYYNPKGNPDVL